MESRKAFRVINRLLKKNTMHNLKNNEMPIEFNSYMDDDVNTPDALRFLINLADKAYRQKDVSRASKFVSALRNCLLVLGFVL